MPRYPDQVFEAPNAADGRRRKQGSAPPEPTMGEQLESGFELGIDAISNIDKQRETDSYGPLVTALVERGYPIERYVSVSRGGQVLNIGAIRSDLDAERKKDPSFGKEFGASDEEFAANRRAKQQGKRQANQRTLAAGTNFDIPLLGQVNPYGFAGQVGGTMLDPVNIVMMPFGGGGKTVGQAFVRGAAVGGATEAFLLPEQARLGAGYGEKFTVKDALTSIGFGAVAGGTLEVAGYGGQKMWNKVAGEAPPPTAPGDMRERPSGTIEALDSEGLSNALTGTTTRTPGQEAMDIARPYLPEDLRGYKSFDDMSPEELARASEVELPRDAIPEDWLDDMIVGEDDAYAAATNPFGQSGEEIAAHEDNLQATLDSILAGPTPTPRRPLTIPPPRSETPLGAGTAMGGGTVSAPNTATLAAPDTLVEGGRKSSSYGPRKAPVKGASTQHNAIDIAAPIGTPIKVSGDGTVVFAGQAGGAGNMVIVDHGDGVFSRYFHMSQFGVKPGDKVTKGNPIGNVGDTGRVSGPHLHYEVIVDGKFDASGKRIAGTKVNPETFKGRTGGGQAAAPVARPAPSDAAQSGGFGLDTLVSDEQFGRVLTSGMESDGSYTSRTPYKKKDGSPVGVGKYGFLQETWITLYMQETGVSRSQAKADFNAGKWQNGPMQERLYARLVKGHRQALKAAGLPATARNMYIVHAAGSGAGIDMLKNPNMSVQDIWNKYPSAGGWEKIKNQNGEYYWDKAKGRPKTAAESVAYISNRMDKRAFGGGGGGAASGGGTASAAAPYVDPEAGARADLTADMAETQRSADMLDAERDGRPNAPIMPEPAPRDPVDLGMQETGTVPPAPAPRLIDGLTPEQSAAVPLIRQDIATPGVSLKPAAIAKRHGISEADANVAINHLAARRMGVFQSAGRGAEPRFQRVANNGPQDVLRYIARNGGLSKDGLGEFERLGGSRGHGLGSADITGGKRVGGRDWDKQFVPGAGPLLQKNGRGLDDIGESLWEAGYFGPPETTPRPTVDDVMQLVERAVQGEKIYTHWDAPADGPAAKGAANVDQAAAEFDMEYDEGFMQAVNAFEAYHGIELDKDELATYHSVVRYGDDPDVAMTKLAQARIDDAMIDLFYEEFPDRVPEIADQFSDEFDARFTEDYNADNLDFRGRAERGELDPGDAGEGWSGADFGEPSWWTREEVIDWERGPGGPLDTAALKSFDEPHGEGAMLQIDSMDHDARNIFMAKPADDTGDMFGGPTSQDVRASLERQADAPMRGATEQKAAGSDGGLFDNNTPTKSWMDDPAIRADMESFGLRMDDEGDVMNPADLIAELDDEAAAIKTIRDCL